MGRRGRRPLQKIAKDGDGMEHPDRKPNRLTEYDYSTNGAYFITICTQGKKKILSSIVGGGAHDAPNLALTDIGKIVRIHIVNSNRIPGITVDKFVIMPDHIHLIILVDEITSKGTSRAPSPTNAVIPHFVSTFKRFCHREVGEQIFQCSSATIPHTRTDNSTSAN